MLDALQDVLEMRFGNAVKHLSPLLGTGKKAAALHEPQMFGGHGTGKVARFRQLTHCVLPLEQHLYHPQSMRVGQRPQTFGCFGQSVQFGES
jgi:hypothetical protein